MTTEEVNAHNAAYQEKYRAAHREGMRAYFKKYSTEHAEKKRALAKAWYYEHHEQARASRKAYHETHRKEAQASGKKWSDAHPDKVLAKTSAWALAHPERMNELCARWRAENPDKVHESLRKHASKRRVLGFVPMNAPFDGAEAHHLDKEHVLYVPKEVHRSIYHNVFTGHNMDKINAAAYQWLSQVQS